MKAQTVVKLASLLALLAVVVMPSFALALTEEETGITNVGEVTTLPTSELPILITRIINAALGLLGIVAVVIILLGGFKWMTAGGNEEKVGEAKKLIMAGVIGLIIVIAAFAIAQFVIGVIINAAGE